jgi:hypothetical protein
MNSTSPPSRARRIVPVLLIAVLILFVSLLSMPFVRWTVAAIRCGHAPIETSDFAASYSYTLPSDGTYTYYPIFDTFACTMADVDGRHHNTLPSPSAH